MPLQATVLATPEGEIARPLTHILLCALDHEILANESTRIPWAMTLFEDSRYC